jgi:hypothetical protein
MRGGKVKFGLVAIPCISGDIELPVVEKAKGLKAIL